MSRVLDYGRKAPASGNAKNLVIFLHGYGADGNDLLGLADPLAPHLPDTVFVAPNAPERSAMNPMGGTSGFRFRGSTALPRNSRWRQWPARSRT